jgi:hypothetical protein
LCRQGATESHSSVVTLPVWLVYLWLAVCESPITSTRADRRETIPSKLYGAVTVIGPLVASRVKVSLLNSRSS